MKILTLNMEEETALEINSRVSIALSSSALWLDNGQSGPTGRIVVKHVTWDSRQEQDRAKVQMTDLFKAQGTVIVLAMKLR